MISTRHSKRLSDRDTMAIRFRYRWKTKMTIQAAAIRYRSRASGDVRCTARVAGRQSDGNDAPTPVICQVNIERYNHRWIAWRYGAGGDRQLATGSGDG